MLTQQDVLDRFQYQPDKGVLTKKSYYGANRWKEGDIAGYDNGHGYLRVSIRNKLWLVHQLIWLYHHGYIPENVIDHIDRNPRNNKIENLREVHKVCNARNTDNQANNTSGIKGLSLNTKSGKWHVYIKVQQTRYSFGLFTDFVEAVATRLALEQSLNWAGCDTTSPAYLYIKNWVVR